MSFIVREKWLLLGRADWRATSAILQTQAHHDIYSPGAFTKLGKPLIAEFRQEEDLTRIAMWDGMRLSFHQDYCVSVLCNVQYESDLLSRKRTIFSPAQLS